MKKNLVVLAKSWPLDAHGGSIAVTSTLGQYAKFFDSILYVCLEEKEVSDHLKSYFPNTVFKWVPIKKGGFLKRFIISLLKNKPAITIGLEGTERFQQIKKHIDLHFSDQESFVGIIEDNVPSIHLKALKKAYPNTSWAFHSHDVLHKAFEIFSQIGHPIKRLVWKFELSRIYSFEKRAAKLADHYWTITEEDIQLSAKQFKRKAEGYIDCDIDTSKFDSLPAGDPFTFLYLGSADIRKSHGLKIFIEDTWKPLRKRYGNKIQFILGGRNTEQFTDLPNGIQGLGFIKEDLVFLSKGSLFVNPQKAGSGLKLKSLIAMAAGRVLITSTNGSLGLKGVHEQDYIVANDKSEFLRSIETILDDPEKQKQISLNAVSHIKTEFSTSAFSKRTQPLLERLWQFHLSR